MAVKSFLGALRSASQLSPNVSLLFSGVVNEIFLSSSLGKAADRVDNPMFGQVEATYLKPFTLAETQALLKGLGAPMFVEWSDAAISCVHSMTGGSPFFVRELAAATWERNANEDPDALGEASLLDVGDVLAAAVNWRKTAAGTWSSIVEALEIHYPDAAYLLSPDVDEGSLNDWIDGESRMKSAAVCLADLGFLARIGEKYQYSDTLRSLRQLADNSALSSIRSASDRDVLDLIDRGESQVLEFKSTFRIDQETNRKANFIEDAVLKSVAGFLNAGGGTLLVGVKDDGSLLGIGPDMQLFRNDIDRFERWVVGDFLGARIGHEIVQMSVKCDFPRVRGVQIGRIEVKSHHEIVFVDDLKLFLRTGNQTRQLTGREIAQFAMQRNTAT